jgi:hypothetical protein
MMKMLTQIGLLFHWPSRVTPNLRKVDYGGVSLKASGKRLEASMDDPIAMMTLSKKQQQRKKEKKG